MENRRFKPLSVLRLVTVLLQTVFFVPCLIKPTESTMSKVAVVTGANKGMCTHLSRVDLIFSRLDAPPDAPPKTKAYEFTAVVTCRS